MLFERLSKSLYGAVLHKNENEAYCLKAIKEKLSNKILCQ